MFEAVLFDLDGTLLNSERHNLSAYQEAGRVLGLDMTLELYQSMLGLDRETGNQVLRRHFGADCPVEEWRARRREVFYGRWNVGPRPGLDSILAHLEQRALKYAVASSSLRLEVEEKLARCALLERFPVRVAGDEVARGKPAPDVFLEAARRLGVSPELCLCVEDSRLGVQAARAAGMQVVFIPDLLEADEATTAACLAVVATLADLCDYC